MVELSDCVEKRFVCNFFFFQNHAEALTLEGTGIENLVSTACLCRERNQKVRFIQGFDFLPFFTYFIQSFAGDEPFTGCFLKKKKKEKHVGKNSYFVELEIKRREDFI